jgi:hypothetical protein
VKGYARKASGHGLVNQCFERLRFEIATIAGVSKISMSSADVHVGNSGMRFESVILK